MSAIAEAAAVEATLSFCVDTGVKPVSQTFGSSSTVHNYHGNYEEKTVRIADARPLNESFSLDCEGFHLVRHETTMRDFYDEEEVRSVYYRELDELVRRETGCTRTIVFDHTRRSGDEDTREALKIRGPVRMVHNDYTDWSGPQRLRDLIGAEAESLLQHRLQVIQVWRAIRGPILRDPLAMCDAQSMSQQDFIAAERRFPDRVGEIYHIAHNPRQRWMYYPNMTREEAIVFKCYDSDKSVARFTAHGAFDDPTSAPDAPPRESMEARILAIFVP
jgi:hypothetical protein